MEKVIKKVDLEKIKSLRKKANLSLNEMAKLLGYESINGYYYLETGRGKFPAETLAKVASIFNENVDNLFFEVKITEMAKESKQAI
ncbi:helix-turn-helix transcriptional regulator [Cytobacillus sp. OWB-43]|uniref:helix-turn-helix transcriptional regulator n=1 Tax=Cytobacillus sp. OWB-43 TaxID=3108468 RepID=UPI002AFECB94|nr:helix-turn-helix transcriptional regulator [Cytobacillus sp. OWB-43]MEA1855623.1 helix-turn-helix transcriptional regulator [Cytobacillus sp. OWB-43]